MMRPVRMLIGFALGPALIGCSLFRTGTSAHEGESVIEEVAQGWEERLSIEKMRAGVEVGRGSDEFLRGDPEMLWMVSRELTALAYGHAPDDLISLYELAYESCFRCLARNAGWLGRLENSGGAVTVAGVSRLTPSDVPCLEQLVMAWTRLIENRGVHTHVDMPELVFLVDRLLEMRPDRWVGYWAKGMIAGFEGKPLSEVETYMDLAYEYEPTLATSTVDYLRISTGYPQNRLTEAPFDKFRMRDFMVYEGHEWALENQRAVRIAFER